MDKYSFLYPRNRYYGEAKPENLIFNANLQEFSQQVSYIVALETSGEISSEAAYYQIKILWRQLKESKKELGIGRVAFHEDEDNLT